MATVNLAGASAGTSTAAATLNAGKAFGDILSSIVLGSKQSVRRNFTDTDFEAYQTDLQTIVVRVRSSDYAGGLTKGTVVYIGGATGNRPYVLKADADSEITSSKTFGLLAEDIAANADGLCAVEGVLTGLNLATGDGWADGDKLWLSQTAGAFTKTVPVEPAHAVFIGTISRAHPNLGTIVVQIQNGYELDEIHGVLLDDPPANGDVLTYETSSGLWKNKPPGGSTGPRVTSATSSASPTPNADNTDLYALTAQAATATFGAPTGTPANGQKLIIRIKDNGTAQTLNWNAAYVAGGPTLPTTTVISKTLHLGFIYNTDNSLNKWMLVAKSQEV